MSFPVPSIAYKIVFNKTDCHIEESSTTIIFTQDNNVTEDERLNDFYSYEGYNNENKRIICYMDVSDELYCYITDTDSSKYLNRVKKIYIANKLIIDYFQTKPPEMKTFLSLFFPIQDTVDYVTEDNEDAHTPVPEGVTHIRRTGTMY